MFSFSIDLILFFALFALFVYVIATTTIGNLHKAYLTLHFTMMLWPLLQFAMKTAGDKAYKLFYLKAAFVDGMLLVIGWFVFTLFLVGQSDWLKRKTSLVIYIPALLGIVGVILNPQERFASAPRTPDSGSHYGVLFWVYIVISLGYLVASLSIVHHKRKSAAAPQIEKRDQSFSKGILTVFAFVLSDVILNVALAPGLPTLPGLTSLGILISAALFVIAIRRDKVFDLLTIAHQDIIDTIQYGILVLDDRETVVEVNKMLSPHARLRVGDRFRMDDFLSCAHDECKAREFFHSYHNDPMIRSEIELLCGESEPIYVKIIAAPIIVEGLRIGRSITFQDVSETRRLLNRLEQLALTDSLTGCYNRYYLTRHLEQEVRKNARYLIPYAFILLDIDWFKQVNDQHGHLVGDEVLCGVVDKIQQVLRQTDTLARYGGEEFMIYLSHTDASEANVLAERIRSVIETHVIAVENSTDSLSVTVSMGLLSVRPETAKDHADPAGYVQRLFASADEALYEAKNGGRNRIVSRDAPVVQKL